MAWSCGACTFANDKEEAVVCAICGTQRDGAPVDQNGLMKEATTKKKAPISAGGGQQRTLFGAVVTTEKAATTAATTATATTAAIPKKKSNVTTGATTATTKPASSQTTFRTASDRARQVSTAPFSELKQLAIQNMTTIFGVPALRKLQPVAVRMALKRKSQIIVMATGGGKSLCYQLPASVLGGVTIVISPLIALMQDQVQALNNKGIAAASISSANGQAENRNVMERLLGRSMSKTNVSKKPKDVPPLEPITLLYAAPEQVQTGRFRDILTELYKKKRLALFAIDEAHCLSTWGHDFRPAYRKLSWVRHEFPDVPCMACTATATPKVIKDIRVTLLLPEEEVPCHMSSFNRPNITYQVRYKDSLDAMRPGGSLGDLVQLIKEQHNSSKQCSGIIYVHKREDTTFIAKQISEVAGIPAAAYHGGLKAGERTRVQQDWTAGILKVAVATVAFGMGIDLAHVRYVVHWSMAKTVEGFYQESGRAGRDGLEALSVLYYSKDDASRFAFIIRKSAEAANKKNSGNNNNKNPAEQPLEALQQMSNYCMEPSCRRQFLLAHFGEMTDPQKVCNKTCDYCENPTKVQKAIQASDVVKDVLMHASKVSKQMKTKKAWDGQWKRAHGDEEDNEYCDGFDDNWAEGSLGITSSNLPEDWEDGPQAPKPSGFRKASSILSKYESLECQENQSDGFVNFRSKETTDEKQRHIAIPEHLRKGLPDPLSHLEAKATKDVVQTSSDLANKAQALRDNLAKLKTEREARLKAIQAKASSKAARPPPPPPPSLAFKKARRKL
jgi:ATP-dependent DNA helicase RecQ